MTLTSTTPSPASTTLPFLSMGANTLPVSLKDVFCANRKKLCAELREKVPAHSLVHFKGGQATTRYDSDHEPLFRQESYFLYLTGVKEPDVSVVIDVDSCQTTLFIPKLPQEYATIMGHIQTPDEWKQHYQVDNVEYVDDIESFMLDKLSVEDSATITNGNTPKLLLMKGINSDSGNMYEPPTITLEKLQSHIDTTTLFNILAECRVIKSPAELSILQYITEITSFAHTYVMRNTAPGKYEYQSESLFKHYLYYNYGCRNVGYTSICACGPNAAVLHYGHAGEPNSRLIGEGDMLLYDMGGELTYGGGYGSDVTCSFPASGKFTKRQAGIFEGVLNAQRAVYSMLKPGVSWVDCHKAAEAAILTQLVDIGIVELHEKTIEELVEMRLGAVFMVSAVIVSCIFFVVFVADTLFLLYRRTSHMDWATLLVSIRTMLAVIWRAIPSVATCRD